MTECALAAPAPPTTHLVTRRRPARRRTRPVGVPRWAWLLGVTVVPLARHDPGAPPQAWVVSAGAGATHAVAVFHDDASDGEPVSPRGSRA